MACTQGQSGFDGHYVYFCSIHAATGMIGTIDVT